MPRNPVPHVLLLLFGIPWPSLAQAIDVSGLWVGYYAYESGEERIECAMVLDQFDDKIAGAMIEPQTFGEQASPGMPADLVGTIAGSSLRLEKFYVHQQDREDAVPVVYGLAFAAGGNALAGYWNVGDLYGTAVFRRVTADSERIDEPIRRSR